MGGTFQAAAGFQDWGIFQKAITMAFRYILSVNSHLSGFRLKRGPTHAYTCDLCLRYDFQIFRQSLSSGKRLKLWRVSVQLLTKLWRTRYLPVFRRTPGLQLAPLLWPYFPDSVTVVYRLTTILVAFSGGDGFFLACKGFGRWFDHALPACAF